MSKNPKSWFRTMDSLREANPRLLSGLPQEGVIIARDFKRRTGLVKQFRLFDSVDEVAEFLYEYQSTRTHIPSFYEYIGAVTTEQKLWFDIDVPRGEENFPYETCRKLIQTLRSGLLSSGIGENWKIKVYETVYSNPQDPLAPTDKHSFHVIVDGIACSNSEEMRKFGLQIKQSIPEEFSRFIDPIWTTLRQMRCLGSTKHGKYSMKFESYTVYPDGSTTENQTLNSIEDFKSSFIVNTKDCHLITV